ncbi:hypothetical protein BDB01DRAFT_833593 [Pilobolus umbonatus]|nr:hypothetical protein BDB01DRAFT_833593 [Pilobolus umbonatus]
MVDAPSSQVYRRSTRENVMINQHQPDNHINESKSSKLRWASCFSFIKKIKKQKPKLRLSHSHEELHQKENISPSRVVVKEPSQVITLQPIAVPWTDNTPIASLSPPPRQAKVRRDSQQQLDGLNPSSTSSVKPRIIKTIKKSSLLRLSLDAELMNSLDDTNSISTVKTSHSSNISFTPTNSPRQSPFKSGTLGISKSNSRLSNSIPPLPQTTKHFSLDSLDKRHSNEPYPQTETPVSIHSMSSTTDDKSRLSLIERRRRRSPLSMPDTEQLTLALQELMVTHSTEGSQEERPHLSISHKVIESDMTEAMWRQQLLEKTIAFSLQNKSRQEAMLSLEGKRARGICSQPIVHVDALDYHFEHTTNNHNEHSHGMKLHDVCKDKAQYDASVSGMMPRPQAPQDKKHCPHHPCSVESMKENRSVHSKDEKQYQLNGSKYRGKLPVSLPPHMNMPQTPPHHKQSTPSLISVPSTPNSIDSSVTEHNEFLDDDKNRQAIFPSITAIILH